MSDTIFSEKDDKNLTHEEEVLATESFVARQITSEIMNYGVTQNQILKVIEFLAMELESREAMLAVVEVSQKLQHDDSQTSSIIT